MRGFPACVRRSVPRGLSGGCRRQRRPTPDRRWRAGTFRTGVVTDRLLRLAPIFTSDQLLDQNGGEADNPSPNPSLEADKLREYLEKMDPRTSGSSIRSSAAAIPRLLHIKPHKNSH
jgi:hypothetical protein